MSDEKNYNVLTTESGLPIKAWTKGVQLEDQARKQLLNVAQLPFIFKWVAAMPDVHWGMGATVGSVIPTKGAIIPAAVGRKDADVIDETPAAYKPIDEVMNAQKDLVEIVHTLPQVVCVKG